MNNDTKLNKWSNEAANVIEKLRVVFPSLSILGIVKTGSNNFYKYEYEYSNMCVI